MHLSNRGAVHGHCRESVWHDVYAVLVQTSVCFEASCLRWREVDRLEWLPCFFCRLPSPVSLLLAGEKTYFTCHVSLFLFEAVVSFQHQTDTAQCSVLPFVMWDKEETVVSGNLCQWPSCLSTFFSYEVACAVASSFTPSHQMEEIYSHDVLCCVTSYFRGVTSTDGRCTTFVVWVLDHRMSKNYRYFPYRCHQLYCTRMHRADLMAISWAHISKRQCA